MSNATHYSLEGWSPAPHEYQARVTYPWLYVKVTLRRDIIGKTGIIREDEPPTSNNIFTFSTSDELDVLSVSVTGEARHRTCNRMVVNCQIGCVDISVNELLAKCIKGETNLELLTLSNHDVDVEKRVGIDVEAVSQEIRQDKLSTNATDSTADTIGSLVRKLDEVFKAVNDISSKMVSNSDDPFGKLGELVFNIRSLKGLDNLYTTVLEQWGISWEDPHCVERFGKVLGLVLFGKEPVSDDDIDNILGLGQGKAHLTLQRLRRATPPFILFRLSCDGGAYQ
ncbi:uncharacterized protein FOMMEDRAFT_32453 [Fomitiporia mediterranea MF3/22]|uniref:Uncharacterized protein n=1 Tax=Fomitiporia mediterranea (strain MF3/22) TaxID=694068 RepID=R7SHD1_FOMME|nr:uncharacterized protein FOMMEDRAFT_32453 [Fomitiporia mediterranea MF3/22]EJC97692.1 hypothetical protein FOMMEDRAFT_32453 [Fomitiporia mediterranea MF3/22]